MIGKPWSQLSELERRRARHLAIGQFIEAGHSPQDAHHAALLGERLADLLDPPPVAPGALPPPDLEAA